MRDEMRERWEDEKMREMRRMTGEGEKRKEASSATVKLPLSILL